MASTLVALVLRGALLFLASGALLFLASDTFLVSGALVALVLRGVALRDALLAVPFGAPTSSGRSSAAGKRDSFWELRPGKGAA